MITLNTVACETRLNHGRLKRKVDGFYIELKANGSNPKDYFLKTTFTNERNRVYPTYRVTPKGWEVLKRHLKNENVTTMEYYFTQKRIESGKDEKLFLDEIFNGENAIIQTLEAESKEYCISFAKELQAQNNRLKKDLARIYELAYKIASRELKERE